MNGWPQYRTIAAAHLRPGMRMRHGYGVARIDTLARDGAYILAGCGGGWLALDPSEPIEIEDWA